MYSSLSPIFLLKRHWQNHLQKKSRTNLARKLYKDITKSSRRVFFYEEIGLEDELNNRLELLIMHLAIAYLQMRKLKEKKEIAQDVFDLFISDMDNTLRELGVGDLSVPKKMKSICALFYQRITQYENIMVAKNKQEIENIIGQIQKIFPDCDQKMLKEYLYKCRNILLNEQTVNTVNDEKYFFFP